jgi:DNA polymerase III delta prime subunit
MNKNEYNLEREQHFRNYELFVRKDNFSNKIDRIHTYVKKQFAVHVDSMRESSANELRSFFKKYANTTLNKQICNVKYNLCEQCNKPMKILSNMSDLLCVQCGLIENLYGTVFEDEQFYYQEGQRTKHGSYAPSKHCKVWVERIQARESTEIPPNLIDELKEIISNELTNISDVTCKIIRKYLRQIQRSKYNEHVPLIRKIITGQAPDQLTSCETQLINIYFDKVLKIYDSIKSADKSNCFYHPYFIYKIIEHILKNDSPERLYSILSCVHLQSRETLIKNDRIWQKICEQLDDVEYAPTYKT